MSPSTSCRLNRPVGRSEASISQSPFGAGALGLDRQHVALDVDVERLGTNAGQVELDDEGVALAPGVHRHHGRTRRGAGTEELLGEPVEVPERVVVRINMLLTSTVTMCCGCRHRSIVADIDFMYHELQ